LNREEGRRSTIYYAREKFPPPVGYRPTRFLGEISSALE